MGGRGVCGGILLQFYCTQKETLRAFDSFVLHENCAVNVCSNSLPYVQWLREWFEALIQHDSSVTVSMQKFHSTGTRSFEAVHHDKDVTSMQICLHGVCWFWPSFGFPQERNHGSFQRAIGAITQCLESLLHQWMVLEGLRIFQAPFSLWQRFHKAYCWIPENSVPLLE